MDVFEAARSVLPWWVGWGAFLFYVPLAFVLSLAGALLGAALVSIPLRRLKEGGWAERARLIYPVRRVMALNVIGLPVFLGGMALLYDGPLSLFTPVHLGVNAGAAALLAAIFVQVIFVRRFQRERVGPLYRMQGFGAMLLVLFPHLFVAALMLVLLPDRMNLRAMVILAAGTLAFAFCAWGGGLFIARAVRLAGPASKRLSRIVGEVAARVGVRPRGVYEIRWSKANAFAFPLSRRLAFTDAALRVLGDDEVAAIAAHELGHLSESRLTALARSLGLFILLPLAAARPVIGSFGAYPLLAAVFLVFLVIFILRRMARRMEERADKIAHGHEGRAGTYARALEAIYEANMIPAVLSGKRRVHPHLYDRLVAAGVHPAYPRPKPPPKAPAFLGLFIPLVVIALVLLVLRVGIFAGSMSMWSNEPALTVLVAFGGGEAGEIGDLAGLRAGRGDDEGAVKLYEAACVMSDDYPHHPVNLAIVLAGMGRCYEAESYLFMARGRIRQLGLSVESYPVVRKAEVAVFRCLQKARNKNQQ